MPRIVEIGDNRKTYQDIKFVKSKKHLKQRLFEVCDGQTITPEVLKRMINKFSHDMKEEVSLQICCYYEHAGWRSAKVFNSGDDCTLYCSDYGVDEGELGGIRAWELYFLPRQPTVI